MRRALILLLALMLTLLTGCYDAVDLNEQIFAINLALDEGEGAALRLTVQVPQIVPTGRQPAQTDSDLQKNGYVLHQTEGDTLADCLERLRLVMPRRLSLLQLRGVYLSESLAQDEALLRACLETLKDARSVRPAAQVYVARGHAEDILRNQVPLFGARLSKALQAQSEAQKAQGVIPSAPLSRFCANLLSQSRSACAVLTAVSDPAALTEPSRPGAQPAACLAGELPRSTADKVDLCGSVLFKDAGLLLLDGYETQLMNLLAGELRRLDLVCGDETARIDIRRTPRIVFDTDPDAPRLSVTLPLRIHAAEEAQFADRLCKDVLELLLKLQCNGLDPIGLSDRARMRAPTLEAWAELDWEALYARAVIEVTYHSAGT